jgi:hypothetical protein
VDVDVDKLTQMLAHRLAAIAPAGFQVAASNGMLRYSAAHGRFPGQAGDYQTGMSGTDVRVNFEAHGQSAGERVAGVAAQALDELQDYIDEAAHEPWPGERTPPQALRGGPRRGAAPVVRRAGCQRPGRARMRPRPAG